VSNKDNLLYPDANNKLYDLRKRHLPRVSNKDNLVYPDAINKLYDLKETPSPPSEQERQSFTPLGAQTINSTSKETLSPRGEQEEESYKRAFIHKTVS
jgi:hypothetical protein